MAENVARRKATALHRRKTFVADLREALRSKLRLASAIRFPDSKWWDDPVKFARDILGVDPWSRQRGLLEACRDHPRVACTSGHKTGKSMSAAILALCWFCSFPDARVVMSSTTSRQVDQILWRELRMLRARGGRCVECKRDDPDGPRPCAHSALIEPDVEIGVLARTGLKSEDFREIVGFTAREAEAVAGVSGAKLLYILDEASGIPEEIFEAIEGNRAGGARLIMFSNPTRTSGEFFRAFHDKKDFYFTVTISSEESPNVVARKTIIPGLAEWEWIEEKRREWGAESPMYGVRILGKFPINEDGKIFSIHTIAEAEARLEDADADGMLFVGIDPAGESGTGDETAFHVRRNKRPLGLVTFRGLNDDAHLVHLLALLEAHRKSGETPIVVLDREGSIGASLHGKLRNYSEENPRAFKLVGVRGSDRAFRQPVVYDRVRDELAANLEAWLRDGGALLSDTMLSAELHVLTWDQSVNGRLKVTSKKAIRAEIGRSPDRYDAVALSVWEPAWLHQNVVPSAEKAVVSRDRYAEPASRGIDPYAGMDAWGPSRR